ncbi:hypothetical protein ASC97_05705 [Rhizobium sp. Root1203]|uniref:hypothetical protein n=1 Tax=Rhizobium sp. Root1203 TaxID=1736427 RepID=UPI00070AEC93|nr:hypothetical protein [Rhizobium sp. Root1203]KQV27858.1 hypothetical protein ASC97_05705 [Rhizobium sp. Root1203]
MNPRLTEEELAQLTDEEREGYLEEINEDGDAEEGDEGSEDTTTADVAAAAEGDDADDAADAAAAAVATPDPKAADAAAAAAAAEAAKPVEPVDEPEERAPSWILPADLTAKMKDIKDQRAALAEKFDEGELTAKEYNEALAPLEDQADELKTRQISAQVARTTAIENWVGRDVPAFMSDHPEYARSEFLRNALDAEVKALQSTAINPLNPKILEQAHAKISGEITSAFKTDTVPGAGKGKQTETTKPTKKRGDPPPTLAHIPAADPTDTDDGGEFAHLDRALAKNDSLAYEKALAALPEAKREQYLAQ